MDSVKNKTGAERKNRLKNRENITQVHTLQLEFFFLWIKFRFLRTIEIRIRKHYHLRLAAVRNSIVCATFSRARIFLFHYLITFWEWWVRGNCIVRHQTMATFKSKSSGEIKGFFRMLHVVHGMSVNVTYYHAINLYHKLLKIAQYIHDFFVWFFIFTPLKMLEIKTPDIFTWLMINVERMWTVTTVAIDHRWPHAIRFDYINIVSHYRVEICRGVERKKTIPTRIYEFHIVAHLCVNCLIWMLLHHFE